jgi:twinkle protein
LKTFKDYGIEVNPGAKGNVKIKCPFCSPYKNNANDTCLSVNVSEGVWFCHKCNETGGLNTSDKATHDAKHFESRSNGVSVNKNKKTPLKALSEAAIKFMSNRGISEDTLIKEGIKIASKWIAQLQKEQNCIAFPFIKGNMRVATKYRDNKKNMTQDAGGEKCFYRFDEFAKGDTIYITEGEIDALTLIECGLSDGVTSVPDGAPAPGAKEDGSKFNFFTDEAKKIFDNAKKVYLITDDDENGHNLEGILARRIGKGKCLRVDYPTGCKDINDVLLKFGKESVLGVIENAKRYPVEGLTKFGDHKKDIHRFYNEGDLQGISTGWENLDEIFMLFKGELNILTGIPNSGKSELLDALMVNSIREGNWKWAVFSAENMPREHHFRKLAEKLNDRPMMGYDDERMCIDQVDASIEFLDNHIDLVDIQNNDFSLDSLLAHIEMSVFKTGINAFIIDPWNEIEHAMPSGKNETNYISEALSKIRRFARKYDLSAWIVAHPSKLRKDPQTGNYAVPTLYDIAGSANWRNKADNGIVVWRDFSREDSIIEVFIQKVRFKHVGKVGSVQLKWNFKTGVYTVPNVYDFANVEDCGGENVNGIKPR